LLLSGATMSQQSSLTQSARSVRQVLTAYNLHCQASLKVADGAHSRFPTKRFHDGLPSPKFTGDESDPPSLKMAGPTSQLLRPQLRN